ncbi:hypothetical protein [Burkholderia oklahomensis]|uniref:hypothetical protein n=1 Tax=Burkholderia oklahomensis TaxID=342113 RepID=UPI00016A493C|nr:hypothetical protein [Burkholderia oklahomensis]AOI42920.1 hypothetical protein WG70_25640 [Burkholderia oklahomensis EO147]AOI46477.1 hypothetical protein WI23_12215 [Burkholderia oklahomensis C6786]KUY56442.1 hypothetical protein WI23_19670 [Burkholderia oklahomensis C6786]KUY62995.1 hypothetical protein WG70_04805 [Burkholderia oklahomensis EO147]MBI0360905.1 hypothetical protein [Burkholderia oklahomensis]
MKGEISASAAKSAPPVASSLWLSAFVLDANWWMSLLVSIPTGGYICLQWLLPDQKQGPSWGKHD